MRPARGIVLLGSALALAGCGASPREEVQAKVEQFAHATAARDYHTLCAEVLAPDLVAHLTAAGLTCDQAMKIFVQSVQNPALSVSKVTVKGARASAVVLATATGQSPSLESIQLIRTRHGWRLESLAAPR
jgi:hypothetical protein